MEGKKRKDWVYQIREKKRLSLVWRILLVLAAVGCYLLAVGDYQSMCEGKNLVTVKLTDSLPDRKMAEKICEQEMEQERPVSFVFWDEREARQVINPDLERSARVSLTALCGTPGAYLPGIYEVPKSGCVMDEKTALELFGSKAVEGEKIKIGEIDYQIWDTVKNAEALVIYQGDEKTTFSMVNLRIPEGESVNRTVDSFLTRYQLTGSILDNTLLFALGKGALFLMPLLLVMQALAILAGGYAGSKRQSLERWLWGGGILIVIVVFVSGISGQITWSLDMIPSRWSDFGFWSQRMEEKKAGLFLFLQSAKSPGQMEQISALVRSCVCSIAACVCYLFGDGSRKRKKQVRSPEVRLPGRL